jgi:hypothetical protein
VRRLVVLPLVVLAMVFAVPGAWADHWHNLPSGAPLHWSDNDPSYPRGYIYWVDNTGAEWPVYSSAVEWDKAGRLDAVYTSSEAACPNTGHCVSVNETALGAAGCTGALGSTTPVIYAGASAHLHTDTVVEVDSECSGAAAGKRRTIACHEMGHSIGLYEDFARTNTCMAAPYQGVQQLPNEHDYNAIASQYNHND